MKIKAISKLLISSILLSNLNISSFASILSEDDRYETFKGSNITIDNILEEDASDIKIEGNTVVNLLGEHTYLTEHFTYDSDTGIYSINLDGVDVPASNPKIYFDNALVETGKTYTIILDIIENTLVREEGNIYYKFNITSHRSGGISETKQGFTGKKVHIGVQPTESTNTPYFEVINSCVGKFSFKNPMVLEGDWTNKDMPEYFVGIQSSFENNLVTQEMVNSGQEKAKNLGKYKVEIKSTGKNLFNPSINDAQSNSLVNGGCNISYKNGVFTVQGNEGNDGISETYTNLNYTRQKLKPNTTYTLSYESDGTFGRIQGEDTIEMFVYEVDYEDKIKYSSISPIRIRPSGTSFTTGNTGVIAYRFDINLNTSKYDFYNLQLEEGSISTEFEPYKESINTFYLNSPLLEWDTIENVNGRATHIKRSNQIIFDGSEDEMWYDANLDDGAYINTYRARVPLLNNKPGNHAPIINDIFTPINTGTSILDTENAQVSERSLFLRINRSRLSYENIEGFKVWLQDNPITVVYELDEHIYEPIQSELSVDLFKGATYISNDSTIPANIEIAVDRAANRAQEAIELVKTNPTSENIAQARYWTNLLRESTLKDEFQSEINNNSDVIDMYIERKTASVNSDVYIKMKNTLSLSLNTNSIIFDDVDVTEDTELKNVVNLTISSSLPYKVNAYLEDEIYNAEKTATIDKSALNVKVSSDNAYKAFINTIDPIILLDNQTEGSNISHELDFMLSGGTTHEADVYKSTIKLEVEQK